jgi:tRNA A37 threonylcarbamoyladenosine dehydratase
VGALRLVDVDTVQESNLNRQLYALRSTLGLAKVDVARARVADIQPGCRVEALRLFVHEDTLDEVLAGPPDLVLDCVDAVGPKVALLRSAVRAGLPVVSSMGAALRRDPGLVRVGDIAETRVCPLAREVRRRLHHEGIRSGIRCVFSLEKPAPAILPGDPDAQPLRRGRTRSILGSLPTLTGIFGLAVAGEAIRWLGEDGARPSQPRPPESN